MGDATGSTVSVVPDGVLAYGMQLPVQALSVRVSMPWEQEATVADMIWAVDEIIAEASKLWTLAPGDLIYTGTPEGVGPLVRGDAVRGEIEGVGQLSFKVV